MNQALITVSHILGDIENPIFTIERYAGGVMLLLGGSDVV
jgi:hypothetical protein